MMPLLIAGTLSIAFLLVAKTVKGLAPTSLASRVSADRLQIRSSTVTAKLRWQQARRQLVQGKASGFKKIAELPDLLEMLAVAMAAGEGVYGACKLVLPKAHGDLARKLSDAIYAVELGSTFDDELEQLMANSGNQQTAEFVNKLRIAISRGTPIAEFLSQQANNIRHEVSNMLLAQAGKNETKMLIPLIFLILPVTVLFAIYPSIQLLNLNYVTPL